ncbi:unnamed protein product, partial [Agarophyton chilense]
MPAPTQHAFSYAHAAQLLRSSRASPHEKIRVARDLLARTLIPHPTTLILEHLFYALKNSSSKPNDFVADYWLLLHDTLQNAALNSQYVPEFPDSLIEHAAAHIVQPACTTAVVEALGTVFKYPLPHSLQAFGTLLRNVATLLPGDSHIQSLATSALGMYGEMQRQEQDHKKMILICIPLLEPFLSSAELRESAEPVFRHAFFAEPNIARDPIISYIAECNSDDLATVCSFLLTAYTEAESHRAESLEVARQRAAVQKGSGQLKRIRQLVERPHVLRLFQDMVAALSVNLVHGELVCVARVRALRAVFVTACDLDMYRPNLEDVSAIQAEKKLKKGSESFGVHTVGLEIRQAFGAVCALAEQICSGRKSGDVMVVVETALAMVKLSVDTVDNVVPRLLTACGEGSFHDERRMLYSELLGIYARTRCVPKLIGYLKGAGDGFLFAKYESIFGDDDVRHVTAVTVYGLPQGQAVECIAAMGGEQIAVGEAQSVALLAALVLESSCDEKGVVVECVCDKVMGKIVRCQEEGSGGRNRCALLFLLSSVVLCIVKWKLGGSKSKAVEACVRSGVLQSVSGFPFGIDDLGDFAKKFGREAEKRAGDAVDACETLCTMRLAAALVHVGDAGGGEDDATARQLLGVVFDGVERLKGEEVRGCEGVDGARLKALYNGVEFDKVAALVASVVDVMDHVGLERMVGGLERFLCSASAREGEYAALWADLLESATVQRWFGQVALGALKRAERAAAATAE